MWCLVILIAHPCYKRPSIKTEIYFFETEQEALNQLRQTKIMFIISHNDNEDKLKNGKCSDKLIDKLFNQVNDVETFYRDSTYMDNLPFNWKIFKAQAGDKVNID